MKNHIRQFLIIGAVLLTCACGSKHDERAAAGVADSLAIVPNTLPGDSTIYGIACDGCNDTILIYLPTISADPDTMNILAASKQHQVFGRMKIGDVIAIIPNASNPKVGDMVVNVEALKGRWCFLAAPTLRERAGMSSSERANHSLKRDSVLRSILQPREFGIELKGENTARPISSISYSIATDENSPVVYPKIKRYRRWHLYNGKLILSETSRDSLGNVFITSSDTAALLLLRPDTMALKFKDRVQGYYSQHSISPSSSGN